MTRDLKIYETGNGGDILLAGNDLVTCDSFENMPYLGMFGGNVESTTDQVGEDDEQRFDFWGNSIIPQPEAQMNSLTEKKLMTTAITSEGRILIEQVVRADLRFMEAFAIISVNVRVISDDWLGISVLVREPSNLQSFEFQYIWDAARGGIRSAESGYIPPQENPADVDGYRITEDLGYRLLMNGGRRYYT